MPCTRWVKVEGVGVVYSGKCLVHSIIFLPTTANDWADIYDGRDAVAGKRFCRIISAAVITWPFCFHPPVPFDEGIYVDDIDGGTETTVVFTPIEE